MKFDASPQIRGEIPHENGQSLSSTLYDALYIATHPQAWVGTAAFLFVMIR
jgi:hypothetical protein